MNAAGWHTVHVRVNDAATGQPTPVRIRFVGPEGQYLAPFGRLTEFATGWNEDVGGNVQLGEKRYAYIDGSCEIRLPPDPITVEISKGPEFVPLYREVTLGPGKLALRLTVERWIDLRREGWYSGDTAAFFLSPHAALLEAAAEDVAVVNLLAGEWWDRRSKQLAIPNILAFSGQKPALEAPGHLVVVNTSNIHPVLGSLGLLNCHRIIFPLRFGRPDRSDDWTLADWCDQCHRKRGLVVWRDAEPWGAKPNPWKGGEALADLILGKIDALEVDWLGWCQQGHEVWYDLLNCGFRVPLVGSSGKVSNGTSLGDVRTYARLPAGEALSYPSWIEAVRAGRTFVTNGPLMSFTVNGQGPGEVVEIAPERQTVRVRAEARSIVPFERLEILANGVVRASQAASGNPAEAVLEEDLAVPGPCWLAARCWGAGQVDAGDLGDEISSHTSPIYVQIPGRPFPVDPAIRSKLLEFIDRMSHWGEVEGWFEAEGQRQQLNAIFREAHHVLLERN